METALPSNVTTIALIEAVVDRRSLSARSVEA
jgi:hypothetical protein